MFKGTIKEIHEFVDKPADDELAKKNGFEGLEAMRKAVAERIGQDYARISRSMMKRQLLDKLAEAYKFAVPEGLVEVEFKAIWQRIEEAKKGGQKLEDDEEKMEGVSRHRRAAGPPGPDAGRYRAHQRDRRRERGAQPGGDARGDALPRPGAQGARVLWQEAELRSSCGRRCSRKRPCDFILELAKVAEQSVTAEELIKAAREAEEAETRPRRSGDELIQGYSSTAGGLEPGHRRCH